MNPMQPKNQAELDAILKQIDDAVYDEVALAGLPDNAVVFDRIPITFPDVIEVQISNKNGLSFRINEGELIKLKCASVNYDNDGEITYTYEGFVKAPE